MKQIISFITFSVLAFSSLTVDAQDKSKRPSPPATTTVTTDKGVTIVVDYSQPSVKGRMIGKEIAPYGQVWRTGANEATTIKVDKDVTIAGKKLTAGKYGLYTIPGESEWTIIFNKKTDLWGSDGYNEAEDALRIVTKPSRSKSVMEKMTITVDKTGLTSLLWGDVSVSFKVE